MHSKPGVQRDDNQRGAVPKSLVQAVGATLQVYSLEELLPAHRPAEQGLLTWVTKHASLTCPNTSWPNKVMSATALPSKPVPHR